MSESDPSVAPAIWVVVLAASAGGVAALREVVGGLPADCPAAIVVLLHRPAHGPSHLNAILQRASHLPVVHAHDGVAVEPGHVYIGRPDQHLTITPDRRFQHVDGSKIRFVRSSANPLLESAARVFDGRLVAVVLTGTGTDATDGVQTVKAQGGTVIAQDPATAEHWGMPTAAIRSGSVDLVLPLDRIAPAIDAVVRGAALAAPRPGA